MKESLERTIGQRDLALLVIGGVIGSGIFLVPGGVLSQAGGSPGTAMVVWLAGGLLSLVGALTYAELGAMHPGTGGLYLYLRDAFGPFVAFLYGWSLFFAISAGTIAVLSVATADYAMQFAPLGPWGHRAVSLGVIVLLTVINVRSTRFSVHFLSLATVVKVAALVLLIGGLPALSGLDRLVEGGDGGFWPDAISWSDLSLAGLAMIGVLWAYEGWQYGTFVAGEVKNPQREFPRGMVVGVAALVVIYVLANLAYLSALGSAGVQGSTRVAADAVAAAFGPGLASLVAAAIIISMVSAAHMNLLTTARVYFVMAQDKVFFAALGRVHPRFGTPAFAVIAGSAVAAVFAMVGTFQQLLNFVVFVGWIFYGLGAVSLLVFRRTRPDAPRPFRVPGYPILPLAFILAAVALVGNAIATQPVGQTAAGLGAVLLGIPGYLVWKRR